MPQFLHEARRDRTSTWKRAAPLEHSDQLTLVLNLALNNKRLALHLDFVLDFRDLLLEQLEYTVELSGLEEHLDMTIGLHHLTHVKIENSSFLRGFPRLKVLFSSLYQGTHLLLQRRHLFLRLKT